MTPLTVTEQPSRPPGATIRCVGLVRIFQAAGIEVVALQGLDLDIDPGELVAVVGASGSGKSTLVNILAGLDVPTAGQIEVAGLDLLTMGAEDRVAYRRETVGFVWQQTARNLFPYLSAAENVALPLRVAGVGRSERRRRTSELLDAVGVGDRADHRPGTLSGGEQQRVALAVALANRPQLLLADEPTGELDSATADEVMSLIMSLTREWGVTSVMVTHDRELAARTDRTITIRDGRVAAESITVHSTGRWGEGTTERKEYAVLDRAGRLQLPDDHVRELHLHRRVDLSLDSEAEQIVLRHPDREDRE